MRFISTRDTHNNVSFAQAVTDCMPADGGLYVPADTEDLSRWILYTDSDTSFANLAGTLTSAMINEEFSPIICETIATRAFPFEPVVRQLDDRLFMLELFHGPTGSHKDFGVSYLVNALETISQYQGQHAVFLDVTVGELGSCMAKSIRGKKYLKAVLVYPKGHVRGLQDSDLVWNGGNIYPVEVDGTEAECHEIVRAVYAKHDFIREHAVTVANTANIGRLLPQAFFYTYAFSQLKDKVDGGIFYALAAGNYSNVVAGLYGWKLCLPVNGFIIPATDSLTIDVQGNCTVLDSVVPIAQRRPADPASPSNIERLEEVFNANLLMMRQLVFPAKVTTTDKEAACKQLFVKYGIFADSNTSSAYAAALAHHQLTDEDGDAVVLIARDYPALDAPFIHHCIGEAPVMEGEPLALQRSYQLGRPLLTADVPSAAASLSQIISSL